jgi:hypothetical protein
MTSLERDSLVGFYYFSAFVICPDKKMVFGETATNIITNKETYDSEYDLGNS